MIITTQGVMHLKGYGRAYRIKRQYMIIAFTALCLITPATNWLIPFSRKLIKSDWMIRR